MTTYSRVVPRDLFNEAKLLKCVGLLSLKIHDGLMPDVNLYHDGHPFRIELMEDGYLTVDNIVTLIEGTPVIFRSTYNSKEPYPFFCYYEYCDYQVFTDQGEFHKEFLNFIEVLKIG